MLKQTVIDAVAAAKDAVSDLAISAVLSSVQEVSYIPGIPVSPDTLTYAVKVVLTNYTVKEIDGDRIQASDVKGLVFHETNSPTPKVGDFLDVGTTKYRILHNDRVMAGDTPVLSQLQLRIA